MSEPGVVWIVPGIGGCDIGLPVPALSGPVRIWLDYVVMLSGAWRSLGLLPDGITSWTPGVGVMTPGNPLVDYYGLLASHLVADGWRVIGAQLDWRGTIQRDGQRLADAIMAAPGVAPHHLVAHSRGGLVCRHALQVLALAGQIGLVGRGVGLAVPHLGSLAGVGLLGGWWQTVQLLRTFLEVAPRLLAGGWGWDQLYDMIRSWPAPYQLLPAPAAPVTGGVPLAQLYDPATWASSDIAVSLPWLEYARTTWTALPMIHPDVRWLDVLGEGHRTPTALVGTSTLTLPSCCEWTAGGDSTVPSAWAVQPGRPQVRGGWDHASVCVDPIVHQTISGWLRS